MVTSQTWNEVRVFDSQKEMLRTDSLEEQVRNLRARLELVEKRLNG